MNDIGFLIEHPSSLASSPMYLGCNSDGFGKGHIFTWSNSPTFALRFSRKEDAELVAKISETLQPQLWQGIEYIGVPRICEHIWQNDVALP